MIRGKPIAIRTSVLQDNTKRSSNNKKTDERLKHFNDALRDRKHKTIRLAYLSDGKSIATQNEYEIQIIKCKKS